jgi:hypothetical protein
VVDGMHELHSPVTALQPELQATVSTADPSSLHTSEPPGPQVRVLGRHLLQTSFTALHP